MSISTFDFIGSSSHLRDPGADTENKYQRSYNQVDRYSGEKFIGNYWAWPEILNDTQYSLASSD